MSLTHVFHYILTSSLINHWTDAWQLEFIRIFDRAQRIVPWKVLGKLALISWSNCFNNRGCEIINLLLICIVLKNKLSLKTSWVSLWPFNLITYIYALMVRTFPSLIHSWSILLSLGLNWNWRKMNELFLLITKVFYIKGRVSPPCACAAVLRSE